MVGDVEMVREGIVLKVLDCLLYHDNVPFPCDVFLDCSWRSLSRSGIPAQNADPRLLQ